MDLYLGQGIDTLKVAMIHSCSLPILMHVHFVVEGLDGFMPCAHRHCASGDKKAVAERCVALLSPLPWISQTGSARGWEQGPYSSWGCLNSQHNSFQFLVFLK